MTDDLRSNPGKTILPMPPTSWLRKLKDQNIRWYPARSYGRIRIFQLQTPQSIVFNSFMHSFSSKSNLICGFMRGVKDGGFFWGGIRMHNVWSSLYVWIKFCLDFRSILNSSIQVMFVSFQDTCKLYLNIFVMWIVMNCSIYLMDLVLYLLVYSENEYNMPCYK